MTHTSRHRHGVVRAAVFVAACLVISLTASDGSRADAGGAGAAAAPFRVRRVLMINSYSLDYSWTENIVNGVRDTLMPRGDVEIAFEFMDIKRVPFSDAYAAELRDIMRARYAKLTFDAVIASDDDALDFLLRYRDELFPGVPVVFCGVNNFEDKRIAGYTGYTGVNETVDVDRGLALIHAQRPGARKVLVLHDQSATGLSMANRIRGVAEHASQGFQFEFLTKLTWDELQSRLRTAPSDSVILWAVIQRDKNDLPKSARESLRFTAQAAPVPVYSLWDFAVQGGVVGGRVTSGRAQGERSAAMVGQILDGVPVASIPILRESPNEYMFDYPALHHFGINVASLPDGSVVRNAPFSFYQTYKYYVWTALAGMGTESIAILGLLLLIRRMTRKSRARLRVSEERYRSIVEDGAEFITRMAPDGSLRFANGAYHRFRGTEGDALLGKGCAAWADAAAAQRVRASLASLGRDHEIDVVEHQDVRADGGACWLSWTHRALWGADGRISEIQAVGRDITDRKCAELALTALTERQRKILDSMSDGLVVTDLHGRLAPVHSAAVERWFGAIPVGASVSDTLCTDDPRAQSGYALGFEQLAAEILPYELLADQLPRQLKHGERHYELSHQPILHDGVLRELLITVSDVTVRMQQETTEKRLRELPAIIGNLMRDRAGFTTFVDEVAQLLTGLAGASGPVEQKRLVHTLKGNTSIYGFLCLAERCHAAENVMAAEERALTSGEVQELDTEWDEALKQVKVFLRGDTTGVRLERSDYEDMLTRLEARQDHDRLMQIARGWDHPSMRQVLQVHERAAERLASRLGKQVKIELVTHQLRMTDTQVRPFLGTLVHLVRNAIDHGLESPEDRRAAGKPETGSLILRTQLVDHNLIVTIADDGRGIDWDALRARAHELGVPASSHDELVAAMFTDGVSTARSVSDVSGRGVGLAAVRNAVLALGGTVSVESTPGRGTAFTFTLPSGSMVEAPRRVTTPPGRARRATAENN